MNFKRAGCFFFLLLICLLSAIIINQELSKNRISLYSESPEEVVFNFAWAMMEHEPIAYKMVEETQFANIDEWFQQTVRYECYSPLLSGTGPSTRESEKGFHVYNKGVFCELGSTPNCVQLRYEEVIVKKAL